MSAQDRVRFCNNPACARCDEHLRLREVLHKAGREVCPVCHEDVVVQEARPRPPRLRVRSRPTPRQVQGLPRKIQMEET